MNQENKNWKAKAVVGGLLVLGAVSVIYSYSKPLMASTKSVVMSDNAANSEDDRPLQVVKSEKTDAIEGFNRIVGLIGDNEALVRIGITKKEIEERLKVLNKNNQEDGEKFIKDVKGKTYKLNLSTLEKSLFNFGDSGITSPDGTKYLYGEKENGEQSCYIVDIKSNTKRKINMKGNILVANWTGNSKYIAGVSYGENQSLIVVYDVQNDKFREFKDDSKSISSLDSVYSSNGKDFYFEERKHEKSITVVGIYKLNTDDGKIEPVMELTSNEKDKSKNRIGSQGFAVIDEGQKLVFQGTLNGEGGLFIYDVKSKKTNKVIQSTGSGDTPFWISPDENKIVYATYNGVWSISAAKFKGNDLVNKILLLKDLNSYSFTNQKNMVWWNNDSNKVTIFESKPFNDVDNRPFLEKGIIHSVYLK